MYNKLKQEVTVLEMDLLSLLKNFIEHQKLAKFNIIEVDDFANGDGYMGNLKTIRIVGRDSKSNNQAFHFVVKIAPKSDKLCKMVPITMAFNCEINFYDVIQPIFQQMVREKKLLMPLAFTAKCVATSNEYNNEIIILENLKEKGYCTWNRYEVMDEHHVKLVCQEYGKFHAFSHALREQKPKLYNNIVKECYNTSFAFLGDPDRKEMLKNMYNFALETLDSETELEARNLFTKFMETGIDFTLTALTEVNDNDVILHGDPWCNNMMFRYKQTNNFKSPVNVCFIDFQNSKPGNQMLDLTHCFLANSLTAVLNNWRQFLQIYYDSFASYLLELGSDPAVLYPFEMLERDWKNYIKYGLPQSTITVRLMLTDEFEAINFAKFAESNQKISNASIYKISRQEICVNNKFLG